MGDLKKMLNPKTVALVGADDREGSPGRSILENLLASGQRRVWTVNPEKQEVLGLQCHATVSDIEEHIDLAVVAVPPDSLLPVIEECGNRGVEGAIIVSSGPQGPVEERRGFEGRLWDVRRRSGLRLIGPGSNGLILPHLGLNATFLKVNPPAGNTAFISQSGTMGSAMLYRETGSKIGFSMFASLGAMVDVDFADLIDFLQEDYFTRSIMLYVEYVRDAKKFMSASRCFARSKPLVVLKPGRYPEGADVLAAHLGFTGGNDAVYGAAFKRVGIVRVKETEDFFDTAKVLVSRSLPRGPRLAVVTSSGGAGIIIADTLAEQKGQLAPFSQVSLEKLARIFPRSGRKDNPLDLSGEATVESYVEATRVCLEDEGVDGVLVVYAPASESDPAELARALADLLPGTAKPVVAVWMGGEYSRQGIDILEGARVPVYEAPEDAVRAYLYMVDYCRGIEMLNETPEEIPGNEARLINHLKAIIRKAVNDGKDVLAPDESVHFLKNYAIPTTSDRGRGGENSSEGRTVDEWAMRSFRDVEFKTVILLISMTGEVRNRRGFAAGFPPFNRVLARRLMEEADFPTSNKSVARRMEEVLTNFSNLVVDFPEIEEIEVECALMDDDSVYGGQATIRPDRGYRKGIAQYPHLAIMPYPSRYIMPWKIRDGRDVLLRPLRAEDEPLVREMLSSLSEETLRVRFFVVMEITHRMLMQFCNIDYDREIAIVVELREGCTRRIIGGSRLIVEPDSATCQFAILVHDDYQKQGLGEKLLDVIIGIAGDKGLREIYGIVLTENEKMLGLSRKMGFRPARLPDGITRVSLELDQETATGREEFQSPLFP